jgi:hypothetical protein
LTNIDDKDDDQYGDTNMIAIYLSLDFCFLISPILLSPLLLLSSYDVYTPTQNIVFHNYQPNPDGHNLQEWMKPRYQRLQKASVARIKTYLNLPEGDANMNLANLGIYGLGKRRTLKQLSDFVGLDMEQQKGRSPTVRYSA